MTSSRLSYHIHGTFVADRQRLTQHLSKVRPHFVLISGEASLVDEVRVASPHSNIIWREGGDRYAYQQHSPADWLKMRSAQVKDAYLYTSDETPLSPQALDWHLQLMQLAAQQGIKLCVMNLGAGQPQPHEWAQMRPILAMLNTHPDLFLLGLREYAAGVVTSGVGGGNPIHIQPQSWLTEVNGVELWHMGRYHHLLHYCQAQQIDVPRMVITHHGFDRMGDLAAWLDTLQKNPSAPEIRGWRSLENQWMAEDWFGGIYENAEHAYFEQLKWANDVLYAPFGAVEAQMIYAWGAAGSAEVTMDISQAFDFQQRLEAYAATQPDYIGYAGGKGNSALQALSAQDATKIISGFEAALAAGFLDATTAESLKRWLLILQSR